MKRLCIFLLLIMSICSTVCAQQPEWTYPLAPEILKDSAGYITLANKEYLLDEKYTPQDLEDAKVRHVVDDPVRKAVNEALVAMFEAAEQEGYKLYLKSGYRSYQTQETMYFNRLEKNHGKDDGWVAYPGSSDHQTGLGVDVLNYEWTKKDGMNEKFALEDEAKWMAENCWDYGFVIRYMEDKEEITKIRDAYADDRRTEIAPLENEIDISAFAHVVNPGSHIGVDFLLIDLIVDLMAAQRIEFYIHMRHAVLSELLRRPLHTGTVAAYRIVTTGNEEHRQPSSYGDNRRRRYSVDHCKRTADLRPQL